MDCTKYHELINLALADDLDENSKKALDIHLDNCAECRTEYAKIQQMFELLADQPQPEIDPEWLKSARNQMIAHLDVAIVRKPTVSFDWDRVFAFFRQPAFRVVYAAALLTVGVTVGRFECTSGPNVPMIKSGQMASIPESDIPELLKDGRLDNMDLEVLPNEQVQVSFQGTKDYKVVGGANETDIRELMAYILLNEKNDGLRMRTVETLSGQTDSLVQKMLQFSLLNDANPGVRLKSIRTLKQYQKSTNLRNSFMKVIMTDPNPAVRIEAMEGLIGYIDDEQVVEVINIAAVKDSNDYVKLLANNALKNVKEEPELKGTAIEDLR